MSRFEEIRSTFSLLRDAETAYWEKLEATQKSLRKGFAWFLGVDADKPAAQGNALPVLYFGGKSNAFTGKSGDDAVHENNELVFTLNVVIDENERSFPPNSFKFRCRTKYVAGRYMFLIQDRDNNYIIIEDEDFTPIFEHLYQAMTEILQGYKRL